MARRRRRLGVTAAIESHSETDRNGRDSLSTRLGKSEEQTVGDFSLGMTERGVAGVVRS